ncbi:glycosyltransferase 8 domain-containing protein 1-like [Liolophura sinensis]|uniref:glycosyltransferase 8 domain-containing protein 1-like n=1 Tax=Liolophura sinensis TaxID=3198878 RepID=UPI00315825E2
MKSGNMANMGCSVTVRRVGVVLLILWLGTLIYLWGVRWSKRNTVTDKDIAAEVAHADFALRFKAVQNATTGSELVHVVVASDENTVGGMIALIHSIQRNSKHQVIFHLITSKANVDHVKSWIDGTELKRIIYNVIEFPSEWVEGKIKIRGGRVELASPLNYARFYLPRLLPNVKGRIVYIDDDCIVQGDIYELFTMKLKPGHIAAFSDDCHSGAKRVTGMQNKFIDYIDFKNEHVKNMKIAPSTCSFNTGVFVTDLSLWGKHNITSQLEYWLSLNVKEEVYGNERGGGGSQPPMMLVFHDKYSKIDPSWHVRYLGWTAGTSYSAKFIESAKLLHWNGRFKPWGRASQHTKVWDRYFIKDPQKKFLPVRRSN